MKDLNGIRRNALMNKADEALWGKAAAALLGMSCPKKLNRDIFWSLKNRFGGGKSRIFFLSEAGASVPKKFVEVTKFS